MGKIWPLYIRIPLAPVRLLGMFIFIIPMMLMHLSGFGDKGAEVMSFIIEYGNKGDWRK